MAYVVRMSSVGYSFGIQPRLLGSVHVDGSRRGVLGLCSGSAGNVDISLKFSRFPGFFFF